MHISQFTITAEILAIFLELWWRIIFTTYIYIEKYIIYISTAKITSDMISISYSVSNYPAILI